MDIGGLVPNVVKTYIAKKLSNLLIQIVDYLMKGEVPPDLFHGL